MKEISKRKQHPSLISGSFHLTVKIGVECQIFVIAIFLTVAEFYNLGHIIRVHQLTRDDF